VVTAITASAPGSAPTAAEAMGGRIGDGPPVRWRPAILRDLDVLVIPSLAQETYSFVAREAIWAGVPIIAATVGALPEAVTDCDNGFLVPPGDVGALRERLEARLYDPYLATHQSEQQRLRQKVFRADGGHG